MPEGSFARIVSGPLPHPSSANGVPRCERYLLVDDLETAIVHAAAAGAALVSATADRDGGHRVCYYADPHGHVIALPTRTG